MKKFLTVFLFLVVLFNLVGLTAKAEENILNLVGTVTVPATNASFVARDHFKVDTSDTAAVKISYLGENFKAWFLNKTEKPKPETTLRIHTLKQDSLDTPIIRELGGEAKAEITLSEVFALMEKQGKGEKGALLTNGYANIFYVRDVEGALRAVFVFWDGVGWCVFAFSVAFPYGWDAGYQILSRNF